MTTTPNFSSYGAASCAPAPVNAMMAAFARDFRDGVDVNLGVGYVNEKTIPVSLLLEAIEAIAHDPAKYRQAFNYGGPHGSHNLIASLRRFYLECGIGQVPEAVLDRNAFIIGPNGATSLLDALSDLLAPGVIVTADPMYYIYCNTLERKGFEILAIPERAEGVDLEALDAAVAACEAAGKPIAFFYFVTVNNPTCTLLPNASRRHIAAAAVAYSRAQGRTVPAIFDLAYELLLHDPEAPPFVSALNEDEAGVVYEIGTLSKVLAPALRIGYLLGRPGPLMDALVQRTSDIGFSAPLMTQEMASYLLDYHIREQLAAVNAGYREKAAAVRAAIARELGEYLEECRGGRAGFYYYLTFKDIETHTGSKFFHCLARSTGDPQVDGPAEARHPRVIYIPGEYCVHPAGQLAEAGRRQLRISYGYEDTVVIEAALARLRAAAEYAR